MKNFNDRKSLFRIDDGEGDILFVVADSFSEAVAKFQKWDGSEDDSRYESISRVGDLIDESKTRD